MQVHASMPKPGGLYLTASQPLTACSAIIASCSFCASLDMSVTMRPVLSSCECSWKQQGITENWG